jgi:putative transposase
MSDHIHTVVWILPTMSVSKALQILNGVSSRELFQRKPNLRLRYTGGHLWNPGKFYRTVGDTDAEIAIQYVRDQRLQQTTLDLISNYN